MLELPARRLLIFLDGGTSGPLGTEGPIGDACRNLPENMGNFVKFTKIPTKLPEFNRQVLNGRDDLVTMCDLCIGIATGVIDAKYLTKVPQAISNARWHTVFTRILNVYVRTRRPTKKLVLMVKFIQQVQYIIY